MKTANLAGAVLGTILKVVFVVVVIYLVYTGASTCNGDRYGHAGKGPDT